MLRRRHQPAGATRAGDGGGGGAAASLSALALLLLLAAAVPSAQAQALSISSTNSADRGEPIVVEGFRYSSGNVSTRLGHGRYSAPLKWLYTPPPYIQARVAANNGTAFVATTALADSQLYYLALDNGDNRWNTGLGGMGIEQPVVHGDYLFAIGGNTPCVLWFYTANYRPSCGWTWNDKRSVNFMLSSVTVNPTKKLVYVTSMVSNYKGTTLTTVFAVNIEGDQAGEHRWMSTVANNTAHGPTTAVKPMTPVYDPHTNYVVVAAGKNLVALNALTGDTVWTNTLSDTSISAPPTITDGIVVIGTGEGVKACCIETGVIMWSIGTQSDPSQVALFTDGTGRIAYTTTSWKHEVGTQPAGFHVLNSAHLEYSGPFTALDACASPGLIAKIPGKFDEPDGCKAACSQNYCNATAFTWFATEQACKCRLDTLWVPVTNNEAVSGQWSAPSSNWSLTNERLGWSMPVVDGSTVYVTAINTTHEIVMALGEAPNDTAEILWMHSTHINNALWIQPGPPTLSTSTLTLVVGSNNGSIFSYCVDDSTPAPPDVPVPDKPWYKQTAYLLGIALGLVSLGLILYCCVCTSVSHTLDSPASKYQMVSRLGSGSYGVVYLVRHRTNKALCALKYLNCDSDESQERALLEFTTMRTFQGHPNMIRVLETFMNWKDCSDETGKDVRKSPSAKTSEESRALLSPAGFRPDEPLSEMKKFTSPKYVCLLMPFYKQGDLKSFAQRHSGPMPEELLLDFAAQVSSLLQYFHARDEPLLHRDLKPENAVLNAEGHVILTDMGCARTLLGSAKAQTFCGTEEYLAPEILDWSTGGHNHSVDWWGLGVMMYELLTGLLPFEGEGKELCDNIMRKAPVFPPEMNPDAEDLIRQLLRKNHVERPSSAEVKAHPFFASISWDLLKQRKLKPSFIPDPEQVEEFRKQLGC
eukprot:Rhum_TRINITY_DN14427_c11_g10::Rhum_TRINITY_DN14427_c11_g10_i1::g.89942::m.89942